jgi:peroxiredoxin
VCSVAVAACVWQASDRAACARDPAERPEVGDQAADFELQSLDGETVRLSKFVEEGPVVVIVLRGFPGYQCPVCNAQVGQFLSNAGKLKAMHARVVLIYPGPASGLQSHAAEFVRGKTLPDNVYLALDPDYEFTQSYGLRWEAPRETAYPATFVIQADRKVKFVKISMTHGGRASVDEVLQALKQP